MSPDGRFPKDGCVRPNPEGFFPNLRMPFYGLVSLANGTALSFGMFWARVDRLFVGVEMHGAYAFDNEVVWPYVTEKLRLQYETDARNVAAFINDQLYPDNRSLRQGRYEAQFCLEAEVPA